MDQMSPERAALAEARNTARAQLRAHIERLKALVAKLPASDNGERR